MLVQTIASVSRRRPILWAGEVAVNYLTGIGLAQLHGILYSEILLLELSCIYSSSKKKYNISCGQSPHSFSVSLQSE